MQPPVSGHLPLADTSTRSRVCLLTGGLTVPYLVETNKDLVSYSPASIDAPHFQVRPTNLVAPENVAASLQCVILGVPPPQVSWTHDGNQVQDTANRYVLSNGSLHFAAPIDKSFAGQYVCMGTNSAGSISSSAVLFTVACKCIMISDK